MLLGALIVGGLLVARYNSLVTANEQIDGAWAQVENVLQRRGDLIPNLVATVQGFARSGAGDLHGRGERAEPPGGRRDAGRGGGRRTPA